MATLTSTAMARTPTENYKGLTVKSIEFNSGATEVGASATTVLMAKIPNGAIIVDIWGNHTCGAATCPVDLGIDATLSAFASALTLGTQARADVVANLPYKVSLSADAEPKYAVFKATATPGTATASVIVKYSVAYTMDP